MATQATDQTAAIITSLLAESAGDTILITTIDPQTNSPTFHIPKDSITTILRWTPQTAPPSLSPLQLTNLKSAITHCLKPARPTIKP